jgi:hypothetical protein
VGPFEHTLQHLYDVDGPCFGFVESSWPCSGGGDWGLGRLRPRQQLGSCCVAVLPPAASGSAPLVFFGERMLCSARVENLSNKKPQK